MLKLNSCTKWKAGPVCKVLSGCLGSIKYQWTRWLSDAAFLQCWTTQEIYITFEARHRTKAGTNKWSMTLANISFLPKSRSNNCAHNNCLKKSPYTCNAIPLKFLSHTMVYWYPHLSNLIYSIFVLHKASTDGCFELNHCKICNPQTSTQNPKSWWARNFKKYVTVVSFYA